MKTIKNFSIDELTKIYDESRTYSEGKHLKKDLTTSKQYILETIFSLNDGKTKCIFEDGEIKVLDKDQFTEMIKNRFPCKDLKEWYATSPEIKYFKLCCEKSENKIDFEKRKIYNAPIIKAKYSKYESFTKDTKYACELMLKHIKEINCGGDEAQYKYFLKIIKRMCEGLKNNICVLIKTIGQGNGKSTVLKFLEQCVIGTNNTCVGTSRMVSSGFNYPMFNKILVKFEELPCFSREQFKGISGLFKTWITEDYINYEDKGKPSFDAYNCHTMFIVSNDDCIDDDDGRRYFILDHINKFIDDENAKKKYFNEMYSKCFLSDVGNCFYSYLIDNVEIENNFDPNSQMPITNNKKSSTAQKLAKPFVFLKEQYLLKNLNINKKLKDLYDEYNSCGKYYKMSVEKFNKYLKESNLEKYLFDSSGYKKLKISCDDLKSIYTKNNWIGEFDEYTDDDLKKEIQDENEKELNYYKKKIDDQNKLIDDLRKQLELLQIQNTTEQQYVVKSNNSNDSEIDELFKMIQETTPIINEKEKQDEQKQEKQINTKALKVRKTITKTKKASLNPDDE
jgi:hypothetical protein